MAVDEPIITDLIKAMRDLRAAYENLALKNKDKVEKYYQLKVQAQFVAAAH